MSYQTSCEQTHGVAWDVSVHHRQTFRSLHHQFFNPITLMLQTRIACIRGQRQHIFMPDTSLCINVVHARVAPPSNVVVIQRSHQLTEQ